MATYLDEAPRVFQTPVDWPFPRLGKKIVPEGARVDADSDAAAWTVFDTERRDLERHGAALTRRDSGLWRLRLDGVITTARGTARIVPAPLRDLTLGLRAGLALRRVGDGSSDLITRVVVDADDRVLGQIDDTRVHGPDGMSGRRIEVVAVDAGFGRAVEKQLTKAGARPVDAEVAAAATVGDAVHGFVREQRLAVLHGDVRLRRASEGDATADAAVHPTRVAIRRLRSVVRLVDVLEPGRAAALDTELSWLSGVLGEVRDVQVLREHLAGSVERARATANPTADPTTAVVLDAAQRAIELALDARFATVRARLAQTMRGRRYLALLRELAAWDDAPPFTAAAAEPVAELAGYAQRASRRERKRRRQADDVESWHRARKASKRARYVNEFAAGVLPGKVAKQLRAAGVGAKQQQTQLGDQQDAAMAADFLAHLLRVPRLSARAAFGCGALWAAERRAAGG